MKTIVIIGAGASGLMAACCLPQNMQVTILEQHSKVGKKILASGNGRCNFTNLDNNESHYNNKDFVQPILNSYGVRFTLDYLESRGLMYIADNEERVYPYSNNANTIRDILVQEVKARGVDIQLNRKVIDIVNSKGYEVICEDNESIFSDCVIVATGGIVNIGNGNNDYNYLKSLQHTIIKPRPALTPLLTSRSSVAGLDGIRVKAMVSLIQGNSTIRQEAGEVLFKRDGLSGIVVFNQSLIYQRLSHQRDCYISLDLIPHLTKDTLMARYYALKLPLFSYLNGIFNPRLAKSILMQSKASHKIDDIIARIKDLRFKIEGCYDYENAQISTGGIATDEIDNMTLESKIYPNLYILGEAMDIDAECGGHNLQWAFSTGFAAGHHISSKSKIY